MVSPNVNRILQEVHALTDAERRELRRLLEHRASRKMQSTPQEQLRQALIQRGLLEKQPPRGKDLDRFRRWKPIAVSGKPVSETIIEERR
jgi:hypothetical protein